MGVRPAQTKRPAEAGLPYKDERTSRISSQHHRRNGKSIQCPSNETTFRGYTLLWASALLSFPCSCYYAPIRTHRNPHPPHAGGLFASLRKCSTTHHEAANLLIIVHIEPVHMCGCVHTSRHAGRGGATPSPRTNHTRTNPHQNAQPDHCTPRPLHATRPTTRAECKQRLNFPRFPKTTQRQVPRVGVWHRFLTHPQRRSCAAK